MRLRNVLYALMASTFLTVPAKAATILVDTDAGTINGVASGGSFNGTTFTTQIIGNVMQFRFHGDLTIADGNQVVGNGSRGASFFAGNNANIGASVSFDFSADALRDGGRAGANVKGVPLEAGGGQGTSAGAPTARRPALTT